MRYTTFLLILAIFQSGCVKPSPDHLDTFADGRPLFRSALIKHSLEVFPIGLTARAIVDSIIVSPKFRNYATPPQSLFNVDTLNEFCTDIVLTSLGEYLAGERGTYRIRLLRDTAVSLSITGVTHNRSHLDAIVKMISLRFGSPTVKYFVDNPQSPNFLEEKDEFFWARGGLTARLFYRGLDDLYSLDISGPQSKLDEYWSKIPDKYRFPL